MSAIGIVKKGTKVEVGQLDLLPKKVLMSSNVFSMLGELAKRTGSEGEFCGGMKVVYNPKLGYLILDATRAEVSRSKAECVTPPLEAEGYWHTHPSNMCGASSIDMKTFREDLERAVRSSIIPPINVIVSTEAGGRACAVAYVPSAEISKGEIKRVFDVNDVYVSVDASGKGVLRGNAFYDVYDATIDVKNNKVSVDLKGPFGSGERDLYATYSAPWHAIMIAIHKKVIQGIKEFYLFHEMLGLLEVKVESTKLRIYELREGNGLITMRKSFGYTERLRLLDTLEDYKNYNIEIRPLLDKKVAVFGGGFIGSNLVKLIAKYIGTVSVIDNDRVGTENVGYQDFGIDQVGKYKSVALAEETISKNPQAGFRALIHTVNDPWTKTNNLVRRVVAGSDLVIMAFDHAEPRLSVMLAVNEFNKPVIDVGVGPTDATIRIWHPSFGEEVSCPACFYFAGAGESGKRATYSALPEISTMASSIVTSIAKEILLGKVPDFNFVTIKMENGEVKVEKNKITTDEPCPWHAKKVEFEVIEEINGIKAIHKYSAKPFMTIEELAEVVPSLRAMLEGEIVWQDAKGNVVDVLSKRTNVAWIAKRSLVDGWRLVAKPSGR